MEPPSPTLAAALRDLRLATPRDLRRAGSRCRSLAYDLPTFDCVWIDALLALRRLTPFQAERLHDGEAERLRLGPYVLLDRLGTGAEAATYVARPLDGGPRCVVKEIAISTDRRAAVLARFVALQEASTSCRTSHLVFPDVVREVGGRIVVASRFVDGTSGRTRLTRDGRLPGEAVAEIARQLLAGLAEARRAGLPHGEVGLSNLRLTPRGEAVLTDHGVRPAVTPVLRIDDSCSPGRYDGAAPERIGTSAPATAASDVYALGCLLWHLLAGRPPFATGDPLAKLTAHRLRPVPDVTDYAPDAPDELIRLIAEMTDADPSRRPSDLVDARRRLGRPRAGRSVLRRSTARNASASFPWSIVAASLFALGGISLSLTDDGAAATLLNVASWHSVGAPPDGTSEPAGDRAFVALPPPDETGTLSLEHAGPFAAGDVSFRGPLILRGRSDRPATIAVTDRPLHLWADEVTLEHVRIVQVPRGGAAVGMPALALIEAQNLAVRSCRFEAPIRPAAERVAAPTAVAWRLLDRKDPTAGRVEVRDSVFRGSRETVFAADHVRRLAMDNVLAVGSKSLLSLGAAGRVSLKNITVRDAASGVIDCRGTSGSIEVDAEDSILDLGPGGRLFASAGDPSSGSEKASPARWSGEGVFTISDVTSQSPKVASRGIGAQRTEPLVPGVEGVAIAQIAFAGPVSGSDAASVARVSGAPRLADHAAGVDLSRLPREGGPVGAAR